MKALQDQFNLAFNDPDLLTRSMTHSSYAHEHHTISNERLEYIGDAVLDLIIADYLYRKDAHATEGVMTKTRAQYVNEKALVVYAKKAHLDRYLMLGIGEEKSGGRMRDALLADAFEAFLGAIFLDKGLSEVYKVTEAIVIPELENPQSEIYQDYKSELQEMVQSDHRQLSYQVFKEEGPSHNKRFFVRVYMETILMGEGEGTTKKQAEQNAAKKALDKLAKGHLTDETAL